MFAPAAEWVSRRTGNAKNDILSGLTVALALVPEAVAFAFVAGVDPLVGLYAAFMVGLITSIAGGRPGMISGATGALAVVMVSLVAEHGVQYLFATVVLMGILQLLAGALRLGKFIRMVPHPVMLGFVNGLAIVIFLAQLKQFGKEVNIIEGTWAEPFLSGLSNLVDRYYPSWLDGTILENTALNVHWLSTDQLSIMVGLVVLTMAIIFFLPKITKAIPSSLAAIVVVTLLVLGFDVFDTRSVGDIAQIEGGLPAFAVPDVLFSFETLWIILPYAVILAAIGLIESLLTMRLIDEITETHGQGNRECMGQGLANVVTGFFGGMGGCAMIGQSMINVNSGGRGRLSGIVAALALLSFILFLSGIIEVIPLAALVGVMFMVVIGTFEWSSFRIMGKIPKKDAFVLILVSAVTVATDLAIAVIVGVIVSALVFAWEHAKQVEIRRIEDKDSEGKVVSTVYHVRGALFFASTTSFMQQFTPIADADDVVIDFDRSRVYDHSGIEAIDSLAAKYIAAGKTLHLRHLSADCRRLLDKSKDLCEVNVLEDPKYFVGEDGIE